MHVTRPRGADQHTARRPPPAVQILAHELGHTKCNHGVWLTAANVLALGTVSLLPLVSGAVEEGLFRCVPPQADHAAWGTAGRGIACRDRDCSDGTARARAE